MAYRAVALSPMVPTFDTSKTSHFLEQALGFTIKDFGDGYAICSRDPVSVHLLPAGEEIGQMEFYFEVDDVDQVWEVMKSHVEGLRVKEPFDRPYGMREIHVELPETKCLMFVGSVIAEQGSP